MAGMAADARAGVSIGPRMRTLPARPGEVVFLPAGTIHALGAGVMVYEIQQPSTITYRLDDWGRVDDNGNPRELHVEAAIAVSEPALLPELTVPPVRRAGDPATPCVMCEEFALELIELRTGESMTLPPEAGPAVFTAISGGAELAAASSVNLTHGDTAVMLAAAGPVRLATLTGTRILRGWVP
jgi:mannose-6-phosphate isomerase